MPDLNTTGFLDDFELETTGFIDELKEDIGDEDSISPDYKPEIHFKSSEDMSEVEDESVNLIITSPPYNTDWQYGSHDDDMDYMTEYIPMLARVFKECYRVLAPSGRMVVNVPSLLRDGKSGGFAIAGHIELMLNDRTRPFLFDYSADHMQEIADLQAKSDWVIREIIQWNKGFNTDGLAPNGSFPRPGGILLNNMHESALVFQKPGDRDYDDMSEQRIEDSKIDKWTDDLCDDIWDISPEDHEFQFVDGEDVPPFPEEFVKRCIALWSYKDDTVLDPFLGRGTTCKVAKEMKRESVGYELREELEDDILEYTNSSQTSLDKW